MKKIIFVANRLPYELRQGEHGLWESKLAISGLVTGVQRVFKDHEGIWIGWAGQNKEICQDHKNIIKSWEKKGYYAVPIPADTLTSAHEGFNNRSLWSLFHYFPNYVEFNRKEWEAYQEYNQLFATTVLEHYKDGDTVFVNDFQLMLLPKYLREQRPNMEIKYFHHITYPTSDVMQFLPVAKELVEGITHANSVGFHTNAHVKSFERSVHRFGLKLGDCGVRANPIGIDPDFWRKALKKPSVQETKNWIRHSFYNKKIILATERLDYTKGIVERLHAFEYLLDTYPDLRGTAVLIQIAAASRTGIPVYDRMSERVDSAVGRLNGKYGMLDYTPVHYTNKPWSQEGLAALYSCADVACVTPLIDGWNLVSNEFVVSGNDNRSLILSKFAGASTLLTDSILVNPYDIVEVGEAMRTALDSYNVTPLKAKVLSNTIFDWSNRALNGE